MALEPRRERLDYLDGEEVEVVPKSVLPATSFVAIEYPAVLSSTGANSGEANASSPRDSDVQAALSKALASLAPAPAPYATAALGLDQVARVVRSKSRTLECRLFQAVEPIASTSLPQAAADAPALSGNQLYRHGLIGDVVDTHNIVCRIRKRTWKRKRRNIEEERTTGKSGHNQLDETHKEYMVETLGVARRTARFRTMADYLYDPGYVQDEQTGVRIPSTDKALHLHDIVRQMDVAGIAGFNLSEEEEEYEKQGRDGETVSTLRMPPPYMFARTEFPYQYGFRQNPTSFVVEEDSDGVAPLKKRYTNAVRSRVVGPRVFHLFADNEKNKAPPSKPEKGLLKLQYDTVLLDKVLEKFEERPMWSRLALLNQFDTEERRKLQNQKQHISRCCYTMGDGCWRDCLVRFGYDPRKDVESRFYQRVSFQAKARQMRVAEGRGEGEGDVLRRENREDETDQQRAGTSRPRTARELTLTDPIDSQSHIFDGVTASLTRGNYLLIDIKDAIVRKLIDQHGPGVTHADRSMLQRSSGWYTEGHWARIRAVLEHRMDALITTGKPASRETCAAVLRKLEPGQGQGQGQGQKSGQGSHTAAGAIGGHRRTMLSSSPEDAEDAAEAEMDVDAVVRGRRRGCR